MEYLSSDAVYMFPSANRGGDYLTSKLNTEYNLVSIINRLTSQGSFVISDDAIQTGELEFNIGGYYFRIMVADLTGLFQEGQSGYLNASLNLNTS